MANNETFVWTDEYVKEFVLTQCNKYNTWSEDGLSDYIEKFKESKLPKLLFVTNDGVKIRNGSNVWYCDTHKWVVSCIYNLFDYKQQDGHTYFSTKQAAEDYLLMNKPCLSLADLEIFGPMTFYSTLCYPVNVETITELVKHKLCLNK